MDWNYFAEKIVDNQKYRDYNFQDVKKQMYFTYSVANSNFGLSVSYEQYIAGQSNRGSVNTHSCNLGNPWFKSLNSSNPELAKFLANTAAKVKGQPKADETLCIQLFNRLISDRNFTLMAEKYDGDETPVIPRRHQIRQIEDI